MHCSCLKISCYNFNCLFFATFCHHRYTISTAALGYCQQGPCAECEAMHCCLAGVSGACTSSGCLLKGVTAHYLQSPTTTQATN